jgi:hypothetical protein
VPIRPDLRKFYRGPVWRAIRARILVRAGARFADGKHLGGAHCEQCHVPDRSLVARGPFGTWSMGDGWHNNQGQLMRWTDPFRLSHIREVKIVVTTAHLNHDPEDNRDENLKALCQYCHLTWDRTHHKETRSTRKDAARPLLETSQVRT